MAAACRAWLADADDPARRGDRRGDRPPLRPRRAAAPAGASVLVPVVRRGDGDGLAFVGHHHQRHRRLEARAGAARRRTRHPCLRRPRQALARRRRTNWSRSATASGSTGRALAAASRLVAKVDSAAVQDGFDLYLHGFIVTDDGHWAVDPAGDERRAPAGAALSLAVGGPRAALSTRRMPRSTGATRATIVNLTDRRAEASRARAGRPAALARAGPHRPRDRKARGRQLAAPADAAAQPSLPHLVMPAHHDVRPERCDRAPAARHSCGRGGTRPGGFRRAAAGARRRRAHGAVAGDGRRGGPRRALPLCRPGAVFVRAWRQGPASVPGAAQGLRPDHRGAEIGGRARPSSAATRSWRAQAPRRSGAPARTPRERSAGRDR